MIEPTWQSDDGSVKLYCGDALSIVPMLESGSADAVIADIPYGKVNRESGGLRNLDKREADTETFPLEWAADESRRIASGTVYLWCGTEQVSGIRARLVSGGMTTRLCIWHKSNPSPMNGERLWLSGIECCVFGRHPKAFFARHCKTPVWFGPTEYDQVHPTQKPLWLMRELVEASVPELGSVVDYCMGSGTTGVCCAESGRRFIGIEKDPTHFATAKRRIIAALEAERTNLFREQIDAERQQFKQAALFEDEL